MTTVPSAKADHQYQPAIAGCPIEEILAQ